MVAGVSGHSFPAGREFTTGSQREQEVFAKSRAALHSLVGMEFPVESASPGAMQALGRELAAEMEGQGVIGLDGPLGAGKTELVKGLAAGLGYRGHVTSPTFTILHEYHGGMHPLYHFDFYRVERVEELLEIGWDELVEEPGICVAEWASRFDDLLPADALRLQITIAEENRRTVTRLP